MVLFQLYKTINSHITKSKKTRAQINTRGGFILRDKGKYYLNVIKFYFSEILRIEVLISCQIFFSI